MIIADHISEPCQSRVSIAVETGESERRRKSFSWIRKKNCNNLLVSVSAQFLCLSLRLSSDVKVGFKTRIFSIHGWQSGSGDEKQRGSQPRSEGGYGGLRCRSRNVYGVLFPLNHKTISEKKHFMLMHRVRHSNYLTEREGIWLDAKELIVCADTFIINPSRHSSRPSPVEMFNYEEKTEKPVLSSRTSRTEEKPISRHKKLLKAFRLELNL